MHWGNYGYGMGYGIEYGGIVMIVLLVLVIAIAAYFISTANRARTSAATYAEQPLDIVKKRFARGEITRDEYDRLRSELIKN